MNERRKGIRIDASDLALEIVSTVIAILLALAANHWAEGRAHERTLHESLVNIRREIASNREVLMTKMALHRRVNKAFQAFAEANLHRGTVTFGQTFAVFHRSAPQGFQAVRGSNIAWQIAQSGQAVGDMPYDLRSLLTRTYDEQETLNIVETHFFDAAFSAGGTSKDYFVQAFSASLWLGDTVYAETTLLRDYDEALVALPAG